MNDFLNLIQLEWKQDKVLRCDGILFANGDIIFMHYITLIPPDNGEIRLIVSPFSRSTVASVLEFNPDPWSYVTSFDSNDNPDSNERFVCGGGAQGSDGFFASCNLEMGTMNWVAYFSRSNPFTKIREKAGYIHVTSSYEHTWTFPIQHPEQVAVSCKK